MTCSDFQLLIISELDDEITPDESAALRAHLDVCPSCRRYAGLLRAVFSPAETEAPPPELRASILEKIDALPIPRSPKKPMRIISICAAAAACLVLCAAAIPLFMPKGADSAAPMEAADAGAYILEDTDGSAPAAAQEEEASFDYAEDDCAVFSTTEGAGAPAADIPLPEDGTLAIITCTGELPEGLFEADAVDAGEGVYYIYIDIAFARTLHDAGLECSVDAETLSSLPDDGKAAVLWIP